MRIFDVDWSGKSNTAFTLHKLNLSNRSVIVLGASVNAFLLFCSVPFRSVPLKNGKVFKLCWKAAEGTKIEDLSRNGCSKV